MQYHQNLSSHAIRIVVIVTPRLQLDLLERASESLREAIDEVATGQILHVTVQ